MKYLAIWQSRCYSEIPDEIPEKLARSNRAPSYKSIAIAILKNDSTLKSIGFEGKETHWYRILKNRANPQQDMFEDQP